MERAGDYEVDAVGRIAVVVRKPKLRGAPVDPPKVNRGTYTAAPNLLDHRPAIEGGVNASVHLKRTQPLACVTISLPPVPRRPATANHTPTSITISKHTPTSIQS